jgi:hypothetical protein
MDFFRIYPDQRKNSIEIVKDCLNGFEELSDISAFLHLPKIVPREEIILHIQNHRSALHTVK